MLYYIDIAIAIAIERLGIYLLYLLYIAMSMSTMLYYSIVSKVSIYIAI